MSKSKDADAIRDYLSKQNRPYSATDIFNNLHKEIGKTAVQKGLDQLVENKLVVEKAYGKQKVYVVDQKAFGNVDDAELASMDVAIRDLDEKVKAAQERLRADESECERLANTLTTKEAEDKLKTCKSEMEVLREKVETLKSGGGKPVDPEVKKKVSKRLEDSVKEWKKRKRMVADMTDAILENYPKKKRELFEEIGIETDEDVNVQVPVL